jgi:hypothetical protein
MSATRRRSGSPPAGAPLRRSSHATREHRITEPAGRNFDPEFRPQLEPKEMLARLLRQVHDRYQQPEWDPPGSVRGALSNERPYRDPTKEATKLWRPPCFKALQ